MKKRVEQTAEKYSLSEKETIVFTHLANGFGAREIADKEEIAYETARWHIKQIYQKTRINRQAEIIRLLFD